MIEFKAECGHTVRTKDEDAGHTVRCSYCGAETTVPVAGEPEIDFLFKDIEPPTESPSGRRSRRFRRKNRHRRLSPRRTSGDPFSVVLRMAYAAGLIVIVYVVVKMYVLPLFKPGAGATRTAPPVERRSAEPAASREAASRRPARRTGLLTDTGRPGLYVGSTPPGAAVYCVAADKAPEAGSIRDVPGCIRATANGKRLGLPDDLYVVEVALAWNDPRLNDPSLPQYHAYRKFRHAIEHASGDVRRQLVQDYFLPDEASDVFVDQTEEQIYLVRQYREVPVRQGWSKGVRALFLPKIMLPGREAFSIAHLAAYLPAKKAYAFDEVYVQNELDFYDVPGPDRQFIIEALERIGLIPYITPDGRTRLFKIGISDGAFTTKTLAETG